jgi:SAM-dependent methyltransferase
VFHSPPPTSATGIDRVGTMVSIVRGDGSLVEDFGYQSDWRDKRRSPRKQKRRWLLATTETGRPLNMQALLNEEHHNYYGRPWFLGRVLADELFHSGLTTRSKTLDLGCGSGRLAIWLIPFLAPDRYFGVDAHLPSLVALAAYEIPLHDLAAKRPRLMLSETFEIGGFDELFDVILDFKLTDHLDEAAADRAYRQIRRTAAPEARLFAASAPRLGLSQLRECGFELVERRRVDYRLPNLGQPEIQFHVDWHQFMIA